MTRIPSSLIRDQASGAVPKRRSNEPTAAQVAMMTSDQIRAYHQARGEWGLSEADQETLARLRQRGDQP